jgi:hypothetical protein
MSVTGHAIPGGARYNRDNVYSRWRFRMDLSRTCRTRQMATGRSQKRCMKCSAKGKSGGLMTFVGLELARDGKSRRINARRDKGHAGEIEVTLEAIRSGVGSPIPFEELIEVSSATTAVEEAIATGNAVLLG